MTDLPPFIIQGQWVDPSPDPVRGARKHPYGIDAYRIANVETREVRIYPTREAAMEWVLSEDAGKP